VGVTRVVVAAAILTLVSTAADTASAKVFDFSYTGAGVSGSGVITTGDSGSPYTITNITGAANGKAITGLSNYAAADNLLYYQAQPYVDFSGLSFSTGSGPTEIDWGLGWTGSAYGIVDSLSDPTGACCGVTPLQFSVTAVPEPSLWTIVLLGVGAVGAVIRTRRRDQAEVIGA
jgi:hypothetical protein